MRNISIGYALIAGLFITASAQVVRGEDVPNVQDANKQVNVEQASPQPPAEEAQKNEPTPEEVELAKAAALEKAQAEELARAEAEERRIRLEELERVKADELRIREMEVEDHPQSEVVRIRGTAPLKSKPQELLTFKISELADALARNLNDVGSEMFVATFVDSDRMNRSNSFGRYMAEELMEKMHKLGFGVVELRVSDKIMAQPSVGMHVLAIQPGEIANYSANTILSGTYKKAGDVLEVHAKIVSRPTKKIMAAASFEIIMDKDNTFMQEMFDNPIGRANLTTGKVEKGK